MKRKQLKCVICGSEMIKREGKFGEFWGCSNFPECNFCTSVIQNDVFDPNKIIKEKYQVNLPNKLAVFLLKQEHIKDGVVYIIRLKRNNLIKIGSSVNYPQRLNSLNNEHDGISVVLLLKTRFYQAFEVFFHDLFADFLKDKQEYFEIPEEYLVEIPNIKVFLDERVKIMKREKMQMNKVLDSVNFPKS